MSKTKSSTSQWRSSTQKQYTRANALSQVEEVTRANPAVGRRLKAILAVEVKSLTWLSSWRFNKALLQAWEEVAEASTAKRQEVDPGVQRLAEACAILWRSKRSKGYDFGEVIRWLYGGEACNPRASIRGARAAAQFLGLGMARDVSQTPVRRAITETDAGIYLAALATLCLRLHDGETSVDDFWTMAQPLIEQAREAAQGYTPAPSSDEGELAGCVSRANGEETLVIARLPRSETTTAAGKRRLIARVQRYERQVEAVLYRMSAA